MTCRSPGMRCCTQSAEKLEARTATDREAESTPSGLRRRKTSLGLRWQPHAAQEGLEARVGTQGIIVQYADVGHVRNSDLEAFLEPIESLGPVSCFEVKVRDVAGSHIGLSEAGCQGRCCLPHCAFIASAVARPIECLDHAGNPVSSVVGLRGIDCVPAHSLRA